MTIGRRIVGSIGGMLFLLLLLAGMGVGTMAWLRSWHAGYVEAAQQAGALTDPALQAMLSSLNGRATVILSLMVVLAVLCAGLGLAALIRLGPTVDRQLRAAVSGLSTSAAELAAVAGEVAAAASQTAAATNETTATVEEVRQTALLAQERAVEASDLARQVVETSKVGELSARSNQSHFEQILADMDDVAEAIVRLDEQVQSVGDVMVTVNDLAEQSNLLAVNASIEAVKSGEAGKGFNVVAQEVKSLARQSKQAVSQVRAVLTEIQKASVVVAHAAGQAREAVDEGKDEVGRAVKNNIARVAVGDRTAEATEQIIATSRQQIAGTEQIGQAVMSIGQAGSRTVAGIRQVEKEAEQLRQLALRLERLVQATPKTAR